VNPALGPFAIAALLLFIGGTMKAIRPRDTAVAIELAGLPRSDAAVRVGGCIEAALGLLAVVAVSRPVAALVAISYVAFCAFVAVALSRGLPIASCGCFGKVETPPTWLHVGITAGASVAAIGMAFDVGASPLDAASDHGAGSVAFVALAALGTLAAIALLTMVPRARLLASASSERLWH
jgi:hypothetical protein